MTNQNPNIDNPLIHLSFRNKLAFMTSLIAFFFLIPGLYFSMLSINSKGTMSARVPQVEYGFLGIPSIVGTETKSMRVNVIDTKRSILNTVADLWNKKFFFVSSMIFLFSVIIPFGKGLLLSYVFFSKDRKYRKRIFVFIKSIGKWSMCDVFITAILLSYLGTGSVMTRSASTVSVMSYPINVNVLVGMHSQLGWGFWYFLAYCLLSLIALQLYKPY